MKREEYEQRKAFAGDKQPSMLRRRLDHDYTGKRIYLITMTTEGRQPLLGTVVGDPGAPAGSANAPRTLLSPLGDAVRREWYAIHDYHPEITVIALQIMPDHLHGILFVESPIPLHLGQIIKFFKNATTRHYRELGLGREQRETGKQGETGLQGAAAPPLHSQPAAPAPQAATPRVPPSPLRCSLCRLCLPGARQSCPAASYTPVAGPRLAPLQSDPDPRGGGAPPRSRPIRGGAGLAFHLARRESGHACSLRCAPPPHRPRREWLHAPDETEGRAVRSLLRRTPAPARPLATPQREAEDHRLPVPGSQPHGYRHLPVDPHIQPDDTPNGASPGL